MTLYQGISGNREYLHAAKYMANVWPNAKQVGYHYIYLRVMTSSAQNPR